jgi:DNA gyrase subunit A
MADQLDLFGNERIVPIALHQEMQRSYLEYAMSVIVGRALPDVRDGLKPVQRRILYAMHELGLTPDRPYRKCARVVGDVLGKYHPHGDQSVYDALVRLVQDFNCHYPLLSGHGNFGSVDNDPPAAMRYTETRLAPLSHEALLGEIGEETVEFAENFDSSQQEPVVLPAQLPFLLLNGCSGIAVGMATNIPPHNLGEIVDGLVALIDRPSLSDDALIKLIPGPDFPTGGEIIGIDGIYDAYTKGRGSITVRGVSNIEEIQRGGNRRSRQAIVITELPFQVNKASWITKVAELVNAGKIEGIADIRDESDRDGMRVVIEMKRDGNPGQILQLLHQKTVLQSNFGTIMLTLVDKQPLQLSLKELLLEFLSFREDTLTRRYQYGLNQAQSRQELVEGFLQVLTDLDRLISILRNARDGSTAKAQLQVTFDLNERQADAILAMPLRRITGIEQDKLREEQAELAEEIARLENLLGDRGELLKSLKKDLRALKRKYATPRQTKISSQESAAIAVQELAESFVTGASIAEPTVLEYSQRGYVRRLSVKSAKRQGLLPEVNTGFEPAEDFTLQLETAQPDQTVVAFTQTGKAYSFKVEELMVTKGKNRGEALVTLLPEELHGDPDCVASHFLLPQDTADQDLIVVTSKGRIKRLPLEDCANLTGRGLTLLKLKEEDELRFVRLATPGQTIVLATSGGRVLSFVLDDSQLPYSSRNNQGTKGIRMRSTEQVVGCVALNRKQELLLVTEKGYMKRTPASLLSLGNVGDLGNLGIIFGLKNDRLAALALALPDAMVSFFTDEGNIAHLAMDAIRIDSKESKGMRSLQPDRSERIIEVAVLPALSS